MKRRLPKLTFAKMACMLLAISGMLVKSTVGEALVWHQHSGMLAHLHVVGRGEQADVAANAPVLGHRQTSGTSFFARGVCTLAVITIGLVFVSDPCPSDSRILGTDPGYVAYPEVLTDLHAMQFDSRASFPEVQRHKSAASRVLARNHALLI